MLACFDPQHRAMTLTEVASAAGLARPTARRLLLTLEELGFVRSTDGTFELTPKVLTLGMSYLGALGLWEIARPHLEALVRRTGESSSMAQLDGSDIVYVARVAVPKIIASSASTSAPGSPPLRRPRARCCSPPCRRSGSHRPSPSRAGPGPPTIGRSEEQLRPELTCGPGARLGAGR